MYSLAIVNAASWMPRPGPVFQAFPEALEHFLRDRRLVKQHILSSGNCDPGCLLDLKPKEVVEVLRELDSNINQMLAEVFGAVANQYIVARDVVTASIEIIIAASRYADITKLLVL